MKNNKCVKFDVDDKNLLTALKSCAVSRTTVPVLECVLMEVDNEKLTILSTDLAVETSETIQCSYSGEGHKFVPNHARLMAAIQGVNGSVNLEVKPGYLIVSTPDHRYQVECLKPEDFPLRDPSSKIEEPDIDPSVLRDAIGRCAYPIDPDNVKHQWARNLLVNRDHVVGTDGNRLVVSPVSGLEGLSLSIPHCALGYIQKHLNGSTSVKLEDASKKQAEALRFENETSTLRVYLNTRGGEPFDWGKATFNSDKAEFGFTFEKIQSLDIAVKRLLAFERAAKEPRLIFARVNFEKDSLSLDVSSCVSRQTITEKLPGELKGDAREIGLNLSYLTVATDQLKDAEKVSLWVSGNAVLFEPDNREDTHYISQVTL